ncbi:MAG TPA: DNA mismatch repair endonuclease MutL, partial [Patescibacteria group bacterium]
EISLDDGGKTFIEMKDNGSGMDREDAVSCFLRHGTSKIKEVDDLLHVTTLGFRGEALAAIGASAVVEIVTGKADSSEATQVVMEHGVLSSPKPHPLVKGTRIQVRDLFSALPARQKFLKSEATEWKATLETLVKQMIVHPEVAFMVKHNGKTIYDLPSHDFSSRVAQVWKVEPQALISVDREVPHMALSGVVAQPMIAHDGKARQFFAVNGHPVNDKMVARAIKDAFGTLLPPSMYPSYALNLVIHPGMVDVNIHPRKDEVRFVNSQEVFRFVMQSVSQSLAGVNNAFTSLPTFSVPSAPYASPSTQLESMPFERIERGGFLESGTSFGGGTQRSSFSSSPFQAMRQFVNEPTEIQSSPIITIDNCFLVAQHERKLLLVDQHAAHERILYNQLWAQEKQKEVVRQALLLPAELSLSPDERALFHVHKSDFEAIGFAFTAGDDVYLLEVPQVMKLSDPVKFFRSVLGGLTEDRVEPELTDFKHKLFATMACKAAVKAGDVISEGEKQRLIKDLLEAESFTCPHGRPSHIEISGTDLEKLFKRTGF